MGTSTQLTRAAGHGLALLALAVAAAACGGSSSAKTQPAPSPTPAITAAPWAGADLTVYEWDGGGTSMSSGLEQYGYTERYEGLDALDHMAEAYYIIEQGLPKAVDQNQVETGTPNYFTNGTIILWQPNGRRDTLLPPGGHGERIYEVHVLMDPYGQGGDAVAHVWFISQAEGDALDAHNLTATPAAYPNQYYVFQLDKATAAALLDLFWVKGAPGASESPE